MPCQEAALVGLLLASFLGSMFFSLWTPGERRVVPSAPPATRESPADAPFVFLQVSDLHLSTYTAARAEQLTALVEKVLPALQPDALLLTGDLTDARGGILGLDRKGQLRDEWEQYGSFIQRVHAAYPALPIIDLEGNHDGFNQAFHFAPSNLFHEFRAQAVVARLRGHHVAAVPRPPQNAHEANGTELARLRALRHQVVDVPLSSRASASAATSTPAPASSIPVVRFLVMDACVEPAPTRHFFGELHEEDLDRIDELLRSPSTQGEVQHVFVLAHFPFNTIVTDTTSDGRSLVDVYDAHRVLAALSGHLHQLPWGERIENAGNELFARLGHGTLELEVSDFKGHRVFRVGVLYRGVFSFVDAKLDAATLAAPWPLVVPLNPKDARFLSPYEAHGRLRTSPTIDALVVSDAPIVRTEAWVDGSFVGATTAQTDESPSSNHPQRVVHVPWNPATVCRAATADGDAASRTTADLRRLRLRVEDASGRAREVSLQFSCAGVSVPLATQGFMGGSLFGGTARASFALYLELLVLVFLPTLLLAFSPRLEAMLIQNPHAAPILAPSSSSSLSSSSRSSTPSSPSTWTFSSGLAYIVGAWCRPWLRAFRRSPRVFLLALAYTLYLPVGPWFVGRVFRGEYGFLAYWGHVGGGWPFGAPGQDWWFLPHLDGDIYLSQILLLGVGPWLSLLALHARQRDDAEVRGDPRGDPRDAQEPRENEAAAPPSRMQTLLGVAATRPCSIVGVGLVLACVMGAFVMGPLVAIFHGIDAALLSPGLTWPTMFLGLWSASVVFADARRRCGSSDECKKEKSS